MRSRVPRMIWEARVRDHAYEWRYCARSNDTDDPPAGVGLHIVGAPKSNGAVTGTLRIETHPAGATTPTSKLDVKVVGSGTTKSGEVLASVMQTFGLAEQGEGVPV